MKQEERVLWKKGEEIISSTYSAYAVRFGHLLDETSDIEAFFKKFNPYQTYSHEWWKQNAGTSNIQDMLDMQSVLDDMKRDPLSGIMRLMNEISTTGSYLLREVFVELFSFSIPSTEAINAICKFAGKKQIVEYMGGTGYWAKLLQLNGCSIRCTNFADGPYPCGRNKCFVPIETLDIRETEPVPSSVVFLSWEPLESDICDSFLKKMHQGQKLIHIGENGGCTGCESTWNILNEDFVECGRQRIPQWRGLHDAMDFYIKK